MGIVVAPDDENIPDMPVIVARQMPTPINKAHLHPIIQLGLNLMRNAESGAGQIGHDPLLVDDQPFLIAAVQ